MKATTLEDIRSPGLGKVPAGSYLITGLPRIRSAWLAALLATEELHCYHEAPSRAHPIPGLVPFGLADPCASGLYPNLALKLFRNRQIVIIRRDPAASRKALEQWSGMALPNWDVCEQRYHWFVAQTKAHALVVEYEQLTTHAAVNRIAKHVLGRDISRARFELFDGLHIEQDLVIAVERLRAS